MPGTGCYCVDCLTAIPPDALTAFDLDGLCKRCRATLDIIRRAFSIFAQPPEIKTDEQSYIIGPYTITPTTVEKQSIGRTVTVPAFLLTQEHYENNYPDTPDSTSTEEVATDHLGKILLLAVTRYAAALMEVACEGPED